MCYSLRSEARDVLGSETPRFHPASRRRDPIRAEHEKERIDELHQVAYSTRRGGCRSGLRSACTGGELFLPAAVCTLHVRPVHPRARQSEGGDLHLRCEDGPNLATVACDTVKPSTDANGVRTVYSQFALKQFAQGKRTLKCAAGTPWTWCLNKPCTVDPANPKKAFVPAMCSAPANGSRQGAIATRRRARPRIGPAPLSMISTMVPISW